MNFRLKPRHFLCKGVGHAAERVAVDLDAVHFHLRQHRHKRALETFVDRRDFLRMKLWLEDLPEAQGDVSVFGCVFHGVVDPDTVKCDRGFAAAEE